MGHSSIAPGLAAQAGPSISRPPGVEAQPHRSGAEPALELLRCNPSLNGALAALIDQLPSQPTAVVVLEGAVEAMAPALLDLRRSRAGGERLILLTEPGEALAEALADGPLPADPAALEQRWQRWLRALRQLPPAAADADAATRVGRWLWLRPEAWIQPVQDLGDGRLYRYPLLEALLDDPQLDGVRWLERWQAAGLLEAGPLLDRIRRCRHCHTSQLNYVDLCPQCHSLEIQRESCLHCFVCGHIGAQASFLGGERLRCPNCQTQLRHIGTDYDRPLENLHCRGCGALVLEASVEARCLRCGQAHDPGELPVREFRPYRLSSGGRLGLRHGHGLAAGISAEHGPGHGAAAGPAGSILLSAPLFREALAWQISINRQGGSLGAGLLALQLHAPSGTALADWERIDGLIERLLSRLPRSDRLLQARDDLFWLLRPRSNRSDLRELQADLQRWLQPGEGDEPPLRLQIATCLLPDDLRNDEGPELLQARLLSGLQRLGDARGWKG